MGKTYLMIVDIKNSAYAEIRFTNNRLRVTRNKTNVNVKSRRIDNNLKEIVESSIHRGKLTRG